MTGANAPSKDGGLDYGANTSSNGRTLINVLKSYIGGGVLALPYAFLKGGYVMGTLGYILIAFIALHCIFILLKCKTHVEQHHAMFVPVDPRPATPSPPPPASSSAASPSSSPTSSASSTHVALCSTDTVASDADALADLDEPEPPTFTINTFTDVGRAIYGWPGALAVDIALLSSQFAFCVIYVIFIGESLAGILPFSSTLCILMMIPVPIVLCYIRSLKWLAPLSVFAVATYIIAFSLVLLFSALSIDTFPASDASWAPPASDPYLSFPIFLSLAIYGYEGIGMVLPLQIAARDKKNFPRVFVGGYIFVTLLYLSFGLFGYLCFGQVTKPIVFQNLTFGLAFVKAITVALVLCAFCTYPLFMFPVTERLEPIFVRLVGALPRKIAARLGISTQRVPTWIGIMAIRNVYRTAAVLLSALIAVAVPEFDLVTSLVGSVLSTTLAFIIPALFEFRLFAFDRVTGKRSYYYMVKDVLIVVVGLIAMAICTTVTMIQLVQRLQKLYL